MKYPRGGYHFCQTYELRNGLVLISKGHKKSKPTYKDVYRLFVYGMFWTCLFVRVEKRLSGNKKKKKNLYTLKKGLILMGKLIKYTIIVEVTRRKQK